MLNATEAVSTELELETLVAQPRNVDVGLVETGGNEKGCARFWNCTQIVFSSIAIDAIASMKSWNR